jgi:protein required for attachment to host cells
MLNAQVLAGHIGAPIIIAAPRTLGEMRKHYHKALSAKLVGEVANDLTGHRLHDIEKAVANA